jgi:hypothetical protein
MSTEVAHGPHPKFTARLQRGRYRIIVEGRYTHTPGLTAAGVKTVTWNSTRPAKRQAELLGLRTAFLCWFMETWVELGGTWAEGVRAITGYPFARLQRQRRKARNR